MNLRYRVYRWFMRLAHRYNWHHTTTCYPDGDIQHWCQWCGLRQTLKRDHFMGAKIIPDTRVPQDQILFVNDAVWRGRGGQSA